MWRPAVHLGRPRLREGSAQDMGPYDVFVTHTLREAPAGHFVIAGSGCQAGSS